MKASHRRILRWGLGTMAVAAALVALFVANVAAQLSGGWDEVFDRSHPQPGDPEVVAAREVGARAVDAEIDRVVALAGPALTAARVAQPALTGADAEPASGAGGCETGQHNWKRDDPYDLACWEVRRAILAADAAAFPADVAELDAGLLQAGWLPSYDDGLQGTLRYWDQYADSAGGGQPDPSADPSAGANPGDGYRIEDLPSARYVSADMRYALDLGFRPIPAYAGQPAPTLADDEYALVITVDHSSFQE